MFLSTSHPRPVSSERLPCTINDFVASTWLPHISRLLWDPACGYAAAWFSRCCSLKQRCMCAASLTFYAGKILSKPKSSGELWRTVWKFLKKLILDSPYDPAIPLLGVYLEKTIILKDTWTPVFIATARHCNAIAKHCNSLNVHQ